MSMPNQHKQDLGDHIEKRNLYGKKPVQPGSSANDTGMELPTDWDLQIETDSYEIGYWNFRGRSLRVQKAIRIPYLYHDKDGNKVREYLLIGFEGSAGE